MNIKKILTMLAAITAYFQSTLGRDMALYSTEKKVEKPFAPLLENPAFQSNLYIPDISKKEFEHIQEIAHRRYQSYYNTMEQYLKSAGLDAAQTFNILELAIEQGNIEKKHPFHWHQSIHYYSKATVRKVWDELRKEATDWLQKNDPQKLQKLSARGGRRHMKTNEIKTLVVMHQNQTNASRNQVERKSFPNLER